MTSEASPLDTLFVSENEFDQAQLAEGLRDVLALTREGGIRPLDGWAGLPERGKVVATLLGVKVLALRGIRPSETATPTQITDLSRVAGGTVARVLRELARDRIVEQDAGGRYFVPGAGVSRALAAMTTRGGRDAR